MEEDSTVTGDLPAEDHTDTGVPRSYEARLTIVSGVEKGKFFKLPPGITILGRTDGDLTIDDPKISRKHAVLENLGPDVFYLKDLASSNGTYVNSKAITLTKISEGDTIRLGDTVLKFYISKLQ